MPTGWRPADVAAKYPVYKIEDAHRFDKYDTSSNKRLSVWIWIQLAIALLTVSYLFGHIAKIGSPGMFVYGGYIFLFVYALTELMDRNPYAWIWEILKCGMGIGIIYTLGDWFGISQYSPYFNFIFVAYFIVSAFAAVYFSIADEKKELAVAN